MLFSLIIIISHFSDLFVVFLEQYTFIVLYCTVAPNVISQETLMPEHVGRVPSV